MGSCRDTGPVAGSSLWRWELEAGASPGLAGSLSLPVPAPAFKITSFVRLLPCARAGAQGRGLCGTGASFLGSKDGQEGSIGHGRRGWASRAVT